MMKAKVVIPQEALREFCQKHGVQRLPLFGSALRDDVGPDSDVDVLVEFDPAHIPTLFDVAGMEQELSEIVGGRNVDVRTPEDVSRSFRHHILAEAEVQDAAG